MTTTLTADMSEAVKDAVESGEYASNSEFIREALRDWLHKRRVRKRDLDDLRAAV